MTVTDVTAVAKVARFMKETCPCGTPPSHGCFLAFFPLRGYTGGVPGACWCRRRCPFGHDGWAGRSYPRRSWLGGVHRCVDSGAVVSVDFYLTNFFFFRNFIKQKSDSYAPFRILFRFVQIWGLIAAQGGTNCDHFFFFFHYKNPENGRKFGSFLVERFF